MMGKKRFNKGKPNRFLSDDDKKNDLFHHYYKTQFNWDDQQIKRFYDTMLSELPATFRVTGFRQQSSEVLWLIKNKFLDQLIDEKRDENNDIISHGPLAKPLSWYPKEMAWQLNASKMQIRKTPELKRLHKFMISETDCGFISRQEAVSMIPPLLLDIESHHKILDICAAPGSKTAQLIEMLHANTDTIPTGIVVANDIDSKRCYMMVHQLQRLQSPCVVVVRQDASNFPKMYLPNCASKTGQIPMQFDRILADVPCSGDGTLRKNPDLWPRWNPFLGVNEHFLQIKILKRSLEMLTIGGRMVYSTCSLNPIEDEAVIAAVLSQCQGAVKLIDISSKLSDLVTVPGLSSWRVMLKDKTWCTSPEDVPIEQRRSFRATLFSPTNASELNLSLCRRVFPQLQNTGGFFIALLEKVSCLPWMNANKSANFDDEKLSANENNCEDKKTDGQRTIEDNVEFEVEDTEEGYTTMESSTVNGDSSTTAGTESNTGYCHGPCSCRYSNQQSLCTECQCSSSISSCKGSTSIEPEYESTSGDIHDLTTTLTNEDDSTNAQEVIVQVGNNSTFVGRPKKSPRVFKEDPFYYIEDGDSHWTALKQYYDIDDSFPHTQLMYRNAEGKRRFYYFTNDLVKQLVTNNFDGIHFVNLGVKTFGVSEDKMFKGYRLLQEGIEIVEPFIGATKRRMTLSRRSDLLNLLAFDMPLISTFSSGLAAEFSRFDIGPVLFQYFPSGDNNDGEEMPRIPLVFAGWRGYSSLRHYVGVHERSHLLRLCGLEPVQVVEAARWKDGHEEEAVDTEEQ